VFILLALNIVEIVLTLESNAS